MLFETFNLDSRILHSIKQAGFLQASKIQQLSIPEILASKDVLASSHSGTGKSAAFIIPLIQKLLLEHPKTAPEQITDGEDSDSKNNFNTLEQSAGNPAYLPNSQLMETQSDAFQNTFKDEDATENSSTKNERGPRIIILTPTREMANQVSACIRRFSNDCQLRYGILVGGAPYPPQVRMLKKPIDFLVATPGRLIDHIKNERVNFSRVQCLVIDELSRMLDMGMLNDIKEIHQHIPQPIQTLFFSSSLEGDNIREISQSLQNNPVRIELARGKKSYRQLKQSMYITDEGEHKFKVCQALIASDSEKDGDSKIFETVLIFSPQQERLQLLSNFLIAANFQQTASNLNILLSSKGQKIILLSDDQNSSSIFENESVNDKGNEQSVRLIHLDLPEDNQRVLKRLDLILNSAENSDVNILVGHQDWSVLHQLERFIGKTIVRKKIAGLEPESSEPTVGTHKSSVEKTTHKTKNRNPYSGRRNNKSPAHQKSETGAKKQTKQKPRTPQHEMAEKQNANSFKTNPVRTQKPKGRNKNNPRKTIKEAGPQSGNTFQGDTHLDERELSWKQYISNISSGNASKNVNKKFRKQQGNHTGFDLNHSPMAINTKKIRDMQPEDRWIDEAKENKPSVQIRVKSQTKTREQLSNKQEEPKNTDTQDSDRIGGKLGINK